MDSAHPMVARSGEDLLAMLPVLFGFQPDRSLVLVSLPPGPPMHARIDMGGTSGEVVEALALLFGPARKHRVERAVLYMLTDLATAEAFHEEIVTARRRWGIELLEVVVADGRRWRPLGSGAVAQEYDVWSHPFVAHAVLEGRVILPSRAALEATLSAEPARVAPVREHWGRGLVGAVDAASASALVARHADAGSAPGPHEIALLLALLEDDAACVEIAAATRRATARAHLGVWTTVVRAAPEELVAPAAAVLAFVAWLAGEGALAWCGVERARSGGGCAMTRLVAQLLEGAVRPETWDEWTDAGAGMTARDLGGGAA